MGCVQRLGWIAGMAVLSAGLCASAQTSTVTNLGIVTAGAAASALAYQIGDGSADWEYGAAKAGGATYVRVQPCNWQFVEQQSPAPSDVPLQPQFVPNASCTTALQSIARHGLKAIIVGAYGPPSHALVDMKLTRPAQVGDLSVEVVFAGGPGGASFANLRPFYDFISIPGGGNFAAQGTGIGQMIDGVRLHDATHATLFLSAEVNKPVAAGTLLRVQESLYPPPATDQANDPGSLQYAAYVQWLAGYMASMGVSGYVEIWNEPPWPSSKWDCLACNYGARKQIGNQGPYVSTRSYAQSSVVTENGTLFYSLIDGNKGNDPAASPSAWSSAIPANVYPGPPVDARDYGFALALQSVQLPPGIQLIWDGTWNTASGSLLGNAILNYSGQPLSMPSANVVSQSVHPYADKLNNPEGKFWNQTCVDAFALKRNNAFCAFDNKYAFTHITFDDQGGNTWLLSQQSLNLQAQNPAYGLGVSITETNDQPPTGMSTVRQADAILREWLAGVSDRMTPISFFQLCGTGGNDFGNFGFVDAASCTASVDATRQSRPAFNSLHSFVTSVAQIGGSPVAPYGPETLPSVSAYAGTYPLAALHMVGARAGARANSDVLAVWQLSLCQNADGPACWWKLSPPAPAATTVAIPVGMTLSAATDTITLSPVPFTVSGQSATLRVSDNPVLLFFDPGNGRMRGR